MEITNKQSNLRKILYESKREQFQRHQTFQSAFSSTQRERERGREHVNFIEINDDDEEDRLVIDLNDDNEAKPAKSLPIIDAGSKTEKFRSSAVSTKTNRIGTSLRNNSSQNGNPH
jgi:hypothetical protein